MFPRFFWSFLGRKVLLPTWSHPIQGTNNCVFINNSDSHGLAHWVVGWREVHGVSKLIANIAMMTFHSGLFRTMFDKLGMVAIAGPPNVGKTKELKVSRKYC